MKPDLRLAAVLGLVFTVLSVTAIAQDDPGSPEAAPITEIDDDAPDAAKKHLSLLGSVEPSTDKDDDPTTISGHLPDGRYVEIDISTGNPEAFEGKSQAEIIDGLAEESAIVDESAETSK